MTELCLDLCSVGDEGVKHLFGCVGKIEKLSLNGCVISPETYTKLKELYSNCLCGDSLFWQLPFFATTI